MMSQSDTCQSCDALVAAGQTYCSCGLPTPYASFADRAAFEVSLWRAYKEGLEAVTVVDIVNEAATA